MLNLFLMGINEINAHLNNNDSFSLLLRTLSVPSPKKKNSFINFFINSGMDLAMIFAPLITYLFQIFKFNKTKSSKGFSKFICFLLFMGNTLRIFFWFGTHFKVTLLYQSIGIVIFQIILIHFSVKYQGDQIQKSLLPEINHFNDNLKEDISSKSSLIYQLLHWKKTFEFKEIWKWKIEIEYYKFMFFIIFTLSILCEIFRNSKIFFHSIGVLSAFFESLCCLPQVIENCKTKNGQNVSFAMIFSWFLGDSFRLFYNIKYKAPIQMITAISIQVTFDFIVCIQLCIYGGKGRRNNLKLSFKKKKQIEEINRLMKKIDELNIAEKGKSLQDPAQIDLKKDINNDDGQSEQKEKINNFEFDAN